MDCLLSEGLFLRLFLIESLLGWLHLEVVLLVGWSLVVHLAELMQEDLFGMDCLLSEGLFSRLFLVESLLGWLHLEVDLLVGWSLMVHSAELLQEDLFGMDCLLLEGLFLRPFLLSHCWVGCIWRWFYWWDGLCGILHLSSWVIHCGSSWVWKDSCGRLWW
jgi:hypothetical protein